MNKYQQYLQTPEWAKRSDEAMKRANHKCQLCTSTHLLQTHHNSYCRVGCELPEDLVILCERCHQRFHNILPNREEDFYIEKFCRPDKAQAINAVDGFLNNPSEANRIGISILKRIEIILRQSFGELERLEALQLKLRIHRSFKGTALFPSRGSA